MIRAALATLLLTLVPQAAGAQTVAEQAAQAAAEFQEVIRDLDAAQGARDRVAALTRTIGAYEGGLAALREALRQARLRETQLTLRLDAESARVGQLLGVLAQLEAQQGPLLLLHPAGPLGTVRSGMLLSDVTPALQAEVEDLRSELAELQDLRTLQTAAATTLSDGLATVQEARIALSQAISDRTALPPPITEDAAAMAALIAGAETLDAFASGLPPLPEGVAPLPDFEARRGSLPPPVRGTLLRRADEADAAGVRRPGLTVATRVQALVTAPSAGTIRYRGPLKDYGNVMILEPGGGYLLILAGLGSVFGETGDVVAEGTALGLMGGADAAGQDFAGVEGTGARETETLYIEMRRGTRPEDPAPWFADWGDQDRQ
ncbi:MAG: peptidoglycan DD-metalloendopeptidase family protein [Paracoccaceae bacterium]|nr:MAG: peptidoglycan DD-metalloendopeptidase family protein [Paracoccaceae bacterium]